MGEKVVYGDIFPGGWWKLLHWGCLRRAEAEIKLVCPGQGVPAPFLWESIGFWFLFLEKVFFLEGGEGRRQLRASGSSGRAFISQRNLPPGSHETRREDEKFPPKSKHALEIRISPRVSCRV